MRAVTLAVLGATLFGCHSQPAESVPTDPPPAGDIAKSPPPDPVVAVIEGLQQPGLTDAQRMAGIGALGRYRDSPAAARALLIWLDYYPDWCRPRSGFQIRTDAPKILDCPAVWGLMGMGEFAAPFLVERDNELYQTYKGAAFLHGVPERVLIRYIVEQDRKVAQRAVESALQRMADDPNNVDLRAACVDFITHTVSHYNEPERSKLFPPFALSLKQ